MRLIRCFTKPRKTHIDFRDTQLVDLMLACANTSICSLQYSVYSRTYKLLFFFAIPFGHVDVDILRCIQYLQNILYIYIRKLTRDTEKKNNPSNHVYNLYLKQKWVDNNVQYAYIYDYIYDICHVY